MGGILTYGPYKSIFESSIIFLSFCPPQAWRRCTSGVWSGSKTDWKQQNTQLNKIPQNKVLSDGTSCTENFYWHLYVAYINECEIHGRGLLGLNGFGLALLGCANCSNFCSGETDEGLGRSESWMGAGNVGVDQVKWEEAKRWTTRAQLESNHFWYILNW